MKLNISENALISKFILSLGLDKIYSRVVVNHIASLLMAMAIKGFSGKMTDVAELKMCHRTTTSYFLSKSPWDEKLLEKLIKEKAMQHMECLAKDTGLPIFASLDDTVNCKTKPSSQALHPIEGTAFHHSHLLGKRVWGHQVQAVMVSCGEVALNYNVNRFNKAKQTKIESAVELIKGLPKPVGKLYFLADSWYSNRKVISACTEMGYYFIGALKTNRIIYPLGIHISIAEFAANYIELKDVDLVTVNRKKYYVYRYEGKLNGIDNAVVVISWLKDAFKGPKALKAFISTDVSLDTQTILDYYASRWCIETFFSEMKGGIGFSKYQIRSIKGIERLWTVMSLFHLMCVTGLGEDSMRFGEGKRSLRNDISIQRVTSIYQSAQRNVHLDDAIALFA